MSQPFIDLTPEFRSAVQQRRRAPMWRAMWIGFQLGCAFTVIFFAVCAWLTRGK